MDAVQAVTRFAGGWRVVVAVAACAATSQVALAQPDLSTCRGGGLGGYIGQPYKRLQKIRPDARFVCSSGCAMTMDFRADRLTVTYDTRTKRVKSLRCV